MDAVKLGLQIPDEMFQDQLVKLFRELVKQAGQHFHGANNKTVLGADQKCPGCL